MEVICLKLLLWQELIEIVVIPLTVLYLCQFTPSLSAEALTFPKVKLSQVSITDSLFLIVGIQSPEQIFTTNYSSTIVYWSRSHNVSILKDDNLYINDISSSNTDNHLIRRVPRQFCLIKSVTIVIDYSQHEISNFSYL